MFPTMTGPEIGVLICATLIMAYELAAGVVRVLLWREKRRRARVEQQRRQDARRDWIIDPCRPGLALKPDGQLVDTTTPGGPR